MPRRPGPDRKAELLAHHCRQRRFHALARLFEALRSGRTTAHGRLPCGLTIDVPPEIWAATNVVIDITTGAVASDEGPLFDGIEVAPAPETAELAVAA